MDLTMTVSIVIPCYNKREYVAAAIESALAQSYPVEVVVVDDGSTDGSLAEVKRFDDRIRWVTGPNCGGSAARNTGLSMATGQWIQFLDADDTLPPEKVAMQIAAMADASEDAVAFCGWSVFHDDGEIEPQDARRYWRSYSNGTDLLIDMWYYGGFIPLHAWLTSRRLIERVGGWNEELTGDDDGELFGRLLIAASTLHFCGGTQVLYRAPPQGSVSRDKSLKSARSFWRAFEIVSEQLLECRPDSVARKACLSRARITGYVWREVPEVLELAAEWEMSCRLVDLSPSLPKKIRYLVWLLGLKRAVRLRRELVGE